MLWKSIFNLTKRYPNTFGVKVVPAIVPGVLILFCVRRPQQNLVALSFRWAEMCSTIIAQRAMAHLPFENA